MILNIIACCIFEDELLHLIINDKDIKELYIFENNEFHKSFKKKLQDYNIIYQCYSDNSQLNNILKQKEKSKDIILILKLMELQLHIEPDLLKKTIYNELNKIKKETIIRNIFLAYGLCGNVLGEVEQDFNTKDFQVFILKELNGKAVDDCIGITLGGREAYLKLLKSFNKVGTLIYTPIMAINAENLTVKSYINYGLTEDQAKNIIRETYNMTNYKNILLIDTGLPYTNYNDAKYKTIEYASNYSLNVLEKKIGSPDLFIKNYIWFKKKAKD